MSFLLLLSISGISINQHFCKEKLVGLNTVVFDTGGDEIYSCCGHSKKSCDIEYSKHSVDNECNECPYCHDEETKLKIKDFFVPADFNYTFVKQAANVNSTEHKIIANLQVIDKIQNSYNRFVPPDKRISQYFLNRYLL